MRYIKLKAESDWGDGKGLSVQEESKDSSALSSHFLSYKPYQACSCQLIVLAVLCASSVQVV